MTLSIFSEAELGTKLLKVPAGLEVLPGSLLLVGINSFTPTNFPLWALYVLFIWSCSLHRKFSINWNFFLNPRWVHASPQQPLVLPTFLFTSKALIKTLQLKWLLWAAWDVPQFSPPKRSYREKNKKLGAKWSIYFIWYEETGKKKQLKNSNFILTIDAFKQCLQKNISDPVGPCIFLSKNVRYQPHP